MALDPLELATIAAIVVVFFLGGPQKIPELARMVAQARKEFDKASKEFQNVAVGLQNGTSPLLATSTPAKPAAAPLPQPAQQEVRSAFPQPPAPAPGAKTGDQLLIEAARRLGIPTQGKTRDQIQQDIIAMAQRSPSSGGSPPPSAAGDPAA